MPRRTLTPSCPQAAQHTPEPDGYVVWHFWADEMSKTHDQQRCPGCGLWKIWVPNARAASKPAQPQGGEGQGDGQGFRCNDRS
jgi:hypothetical protein